MQQTSDIINDTVKHSFNEYVRSISHSFSTGSLKETEYEHNFRINERSSHSSIPNINEFILEELITNYNFDASDSPCDVNPIIEYPLYIIEFILSLITFMMFYGNMFMIVVLMFKSDNDHPYVSYFLIKVINLAMVGLIICISTTPNTYKAINILTKIMMINTIVYGYSPMMFIIYFLIHLLSIVLSSIIVLFEVNNIISDIPTDYLINTIFFPNQSIQVNAMFVIATIFYHFVVIIGLIIISQSSNSYNVKTNVIQKLLLITIVSAPYEIMFGPITYALPNLFLYIGIIISKNAYELFDINVILSYICSTLIIMIIYPLVALLIKVKGRKKIIRYIEYGSC